MGGRRGKEGEGGGRRGKEGEGGEGGNGTNTFLLEHRVL
jgi:hypothetical protein